MVNGWRWRSGLFLVLVSLVLPTVSRADDLGRREVAEPAAAVSDTAGRLEYILEILDREQRPAKWWTWGWQVGFAAIALGQGTWALVSDDPDVKAERGVGAVAASIGTISQINAWLPSRKGRAAVSATGPIEARLAEAEDVLKAGYKKERFTRGILTHLGALAVAGGSALILWKVYDLPDKAAINFPIALSVGQLRVWSSPILSLRGWQAYESAYPKQQKVSFGIMPQRKGLALALRF
ncbi:MAG: hypothetical protein D6761_04390 [Candidatus Dadabacteria bacterium]|nr:MAG: hypothetical protein D6761_04390 [Candidatus Dadabacteria bacterium]